MPGGASGAGAGRDRRLPGHRAQAGARGRGRRPGDPAGQAGTSSRIENFPGFPEGVAGADLAAAAHAQARRFGAEILVGVDLVGARPLEGGGIDLELVNGARFTARAGVVATGVQWRRLDAPGVEELRGAGVAYGAAGTEAAELAGRRVAIVGGANSAGRCRGTWWSGSSGTRGSRS